jgi:hypothetical protein
LVSYRCWQYVILSTAKPIIFFFIDGKMTKILGFDNRIRRKVGTNILWIIWTPASTGMFILRRLNCWSEQPALMQMQKIKQNEQLIQRWIFFINLLCKWC